MNSYMFGLCKVLDIIAWKSFKKIYSYKYFRAFGLCGCRRKSLYKASNFSMDHCELLMLNLLLDYAHTSWNQSKFVILLLRGTFVLRGMISYHGMYRHNIVYGPGG